MSQINVKKTDSPQTPSTDRVGIFIDTSGQPKTIDDAGTETPLAGASDFVDLGDVPSAYTGQAGSFVRVNSTPDGLEFGSVSPYDLDQAGATDGQVLAWSDANSRYEPTTASGGGVDGTSEARQTVSTSGQIDDLAFTSRTIVFTGTGVTLTGIAGGTDGMELVLVNYTSGLMSLLSQNTSSLAENRFRGSVTFERFGQSVRVKYISALNKWIILSGFWWTDSASDLLETYSQVGIGPSSALNNVDLQIAGSSNANRLIIRDSANAITFRVFSDGVMSNIGPAAFGQSTGSSNYNILIKSKTGGAILGYYNSTGDISFRIYESGSFSTNGGVSIGDQSLKESDGSLYVDANINAPNLPTSDPGVAGRLWNDSGTVKISAG